MEGVAVYKDYIECMTGFSSVDFEEKQNILIHTSLT